MSGVVAARSSTAKLMALAAACVVLPFLALTWWDAAPPPEVDGTAVIAAPDDSPSERAPTALPRSPLDRAARPRRLDPLARPALGDAWLELRCTCTTRSPVDHSPAHAPLEVLVTRLKGDAGRRARDLYQLLSLDPTQIVPAQTTVGGLVTGPRNWGSKLGEEFTGSIDIHAGRNTLTIACERLPAVAVTVVDERGVPIAGASVSLVDELSRVDFSETTSIGVGSGGPARLPSTWAPRTSDDLGRVRFAPLGTDAVWSLSASAPGTVPVVERSLCTSPSSPRIERTLVLRSAPTVNGRVLSPEGAPAAGVAVRLSGEDALGTLERRTHTDAEGRFTFDAVSPDRVVVQTLDATHVDDAVELAPGRSDEPTLRLTEGVALRGELRGWPAAVPKTLTLVAEPADDAPALARARRRECVPDGGGRFALGPLPPGRVRLSEPYTGLERVVRSDESPIVHVPIASERKLDLFLLDDHGDPVESAVGVTRSVDQLTGPRELVFEESRGRLTLHVPAGRSGAVELAVPGWQVAHVPDAAAEPGSRELLLSLAPADLVSVYVVDDAGRPIPGARVLIEGPGALPERPELHAQERPPTEPGGPPIHRLGRLGDDQGLLLLEHRGPFVHELIATAPGHFPAACSLLPETRELTLVLTRIGSVIDPVLESDGG